MLPKYHYDHNCSIRFNDSSWISEQIGLLPIALQSQVAKKYSDVYFELTTKEDKKARFRSNTWLRKTVQKYKIEIIEDGTYF